MTVAPDHVIEKTAPPSGQFAGLIIVLASLLSVVALAHHPTAQARDPAAFVAAIARKAAMDRLVHGSMILFIGALVYGFSYLTVRLEGTTPWALAAFIAYAVGAIGMVGAASVDGFVVPDLVARYQDQPAEQLQTMRHLLGLCLVIIRAWARLGVITMSLAYVLWSVALLARPGGVRVVGAIGCIAGASLVIAALSGILPMTMHGMLVLGVAQTVWSVAIGILLMRGRI